ncbi:MAG: hypothetical protein KDD29_11245, partial [Flavobacteriales bacterium]|nr:hypothetical protein [Flavobacteriales bacterium]
MKKKKQYSKSKKRILFRADGSVSIGYGHIIRLLSLCSILRKEYRCVFTTQNPDKYLIDQIKENCDELIVLPKTKNLTKEALYISNNISNPNDIIILDGYNFDTNYQRQIKTNVFKLVCIDDNHEIDFVADAIINHGEGIRQKDYVTKNYTRIYLG